MNGSVYATSPDASRRRAHFISLVNRYRNLAGESAGVEPGRAAYARYVQAQNAAQGRPAAPSAVLGMDA